MNVGGMVMSIINRRKLSNFFGLSDEDGYEEEYQQEETQENENQNVRQEQARFQQSRPQQEETPNQNYQSRPEKIVPMRHPERKTGASTNNAQITIVEPRVYSEALTIAKKIINQEAVIVNFQLIEEAQARRIVDFLTGTVYALGGDIQRIGSEIFLCTPENIVIDGATAKSLLQDEFQQF